MKYFAKLDDNNTVLTVAPVHEGSAATEAKGIAFLEKIYGPSSWKECSIDKSMRKNSPFIGGTYDEGRDAFIPPKPFPSWILNETTCDWDPPVPRPNSSVSHGWDEENSSWVPNPHS